MLTREQTETLKRLSQLTDIDYAIKKSLRKSGLALRSLLPAQVIPVRSEEESLAVVEGLLQGVPVFQPAGQVCEIPIVWLNCQLLDATKADLLAKVFANIMARGGLMAMAEANASGVGPVAKICGYDFFAATSNKRGQGCVVAWQPDTWQLVSSCEHWETAAIGPLPELRVTAEVVLRHLASGKMLRFLASHFKSLRGGWELTAEVRFAQAKNLLETIGRSPLIPTIAAGDYNCFLNRLRAYGNKDVDPFVTENWSLLGGWQDTRPTQLLGARLDGMFFKWLEEGMRFDHYQTIPVYAAAPEVTDHAILMGTLCL
jgi:hypothetical protein